MRQILLWARRIRANIIVLLHLLDWHRRAGLELGLAVLEEGSRALRIGRLLRVVDVRAQFLV